MQVVGQPDIVIVEGLNVLQTGSGRAGRPMPMFVSDFFDFSIYVDAQRGRHRAVVRRALPDAARDGLPEPVVVLPPLCVADARGGRRTTARRSGQTINLVNLRENVLPTRERAHLILEKGRDHAVRTVRLRKL